MTFSYVKTYKTAIQLKIQNTSINSEVSHALFKSGDPCTPWDNFSDLQRHRLPLPVLELRIKRILQSSCVPNFFHSACFWDSPMLLLNVSAVCSFLLLRSLNKLPFVYSFCSTGTYLGYFYLGAITNKVFEWKYSSSLEKYFARSQSSYIFNFIRKCQSSSEWLGHFILPWAIYESCSISSPTLGIVSLFNSC